jgi:hypothetical protein
MSPIMRGPALVGSIASMQNSILENMGKVGEDLLASGELAVAISTTRSMKRLEEKDTTIIFSKKKKTGINSFTIKTILIRMWISSRLV